MGDTNVSLQSQHQSSLQSLFHALDPISLILSQNSDNPLPLKLTTQSLERGPRYEAYAKLRESKMMRDENSSIPEDEQIAYNFKQTLSPPPSTRKQVKFQPNSRKGSSVLAQSVPDFSATLRKENRRPPLVARDLTPPPPVSKNWSKVSAILSNSRGSKSAGEKARKRYASVEELKGLSLAAAKAITGENRAAKPF